VSRVDLVYQLELIFRRITFRNLQTIKTRIE
jgi:hypothetical protein